MKINLTPEEFKKCLPTQFQGNLNPEAINSINRALADPDTAETIRDNLVSYTEILKGGKFSWIWNLGNLFFIFGYIQSIDSSF